MEIFPVNSEDYMHDGEKTWQNELTGTSACYADSALESNLPVPLLSNADLPASLVSDAAEVLAPILREMDLTWEQSFLLRQALMDLEVTEAYETVHESLQKADLQLLEWISTGDWLSFAISGQNFDSKSSHDSSHDIDGNQKLNTELNWERLDNGGKWKCLSEDDTAIDAEVIDGDAIQKPLCGGAAATLALDDNDILEKMVVSGNLREAAGAALKLAQKKRLNSQTAIIAYKSSGNDIYARTVFLSAFGLSGAESFFSHLLEAMKDPEPQIRFNAIKGLRSYIHRLSPSHLSEAIRDRESNVANAARTLLALFPGG
ncbi:MAG: hypothetical protein CVV64_09785 [Candidatus Wallbacteria bacterium HGW-Wallbacteria-1]|jgi:hypothetical protein|uniref:HEAT repeat domain-containing protein n=1 Tax=Candidatus Wallbacteria bacterium HGW-Wallbacteria-1 TaxID=2013854 RepID=A0A2N1PQM4_9BACT|nr:MAG: hypothetical protein CVV64_09785 [Candidatus Wallbacteria bacterium HGW-Wallbacteria-1]